MSSATISLSGERSVAGMRTGAPIHERRRGEAHRRPGWVGGVYPSAHFMARTTAFDGRNASTRAARQRRAQVCGEVTVGSD